MEENPSAGTVACLIRVVPANVALFRFLLEAYGHVGYFSVLERSTALIKFVAPRACADTARSVLKEIAQTIPLTVEPWPFSP